MDRLTEYTPLVNEFVNKNNIHVLTINSVVKTIADVVRNYLLAGADPGFFLGGCITKEWSD